MTDNNDSFSELRKVKTIVGKISDLELQKRQFLSVHDLDKATVAIKEIKALKQSFFEILENDYQITITGKNEVLFSKKGEIGK